jgi:hypothetical protein
MVELRGYLPQNEALAAMDETDYVLLINHDPLNVGGKFYDYVGGGKPILGAVQSGGETRRLFEEFRAGWWADIHDVKGIRQLFIAQYERKVLSHRYADLLHSIAGNTAKCAPEPLTADLVGKAG